MSPLERLRNSCKPGRRAYATGVRTADLKLAIEALTRAERFLYQRTSRNEDAAFKTLTKLQQEQSP